MPFIKSSTFEEGELLNKWFHSRLMRRNQNCLIAVTGGTGSGKSYTCHRIAELWYKYHFKKQYDVQRNTCFSIGEVMRLLNSGKLKKGELIIFEEAGANLGSLDFQQKISKMFTYVLQSFRSMNVGILFNLPVLTMLNKSARYLLHGHFITAGIDYDDKTSETKPFFRSVNQSSGKIYDKYLKVKVRGRTKKVKRFEYNLPSPDIIKLYEAKKFKFVSELNASFSSDLDKIDKENLRKMGRSLLTEMQQKVYDYTIDGLNQTQIATELGTTQQSVSNCIRLINKKGYTTKYPENPLEKRHSQPLSPLQSRT